MAKEQRSERRTPPPSKTEFTSSARPRPHAAHPPRGRAHHSTSASPTRSSSSFHSPMHASHSECRCGLSSRCTPLSLRLLRSHPLSLSSLHHAVPSRLPRQLVSISPNVGVTPPSLLRIEFCRPPFSPLALVQLGRTRIASPVGQLAVLCSPEPAAGSPHCSTRRTYSRLENANLSTGHAARDNGVSTASKGGTGDRFSRAAKQRTVSAAQLVEARRRHRLVVDHRPVGAVEVDQEGPAGAYTVTASSSKTEREERRALCERLGVAKLVALSDLAELEHGVLL